MRLSGSISYRLSTSYRKLSDEEKINWCVRTCAITHAIFALGTIPGWVSPPDSYEKDRMYGMPPALCILSREPHVLIAIASGLRVSVSGLLLAWLRHDTCELSAAIYISYLERSHDDEH
jgi:hypothetical protein